MQPGEECLYQKSRIFITGSQEEPPLVSDTKDYKTLGKTQLQPHFWVTMTVTSFRLKQSMKANLYRVKKKRNKELDCMRERDENAGVCV